MVSRLDTIRQALLQPQRAAKKLQQEWEAKGRLGEILVESWLREDGKLGVWPVPQTRETKREYIQGNGKRPDFLVAPLDNENDIVLVDAKFHALGSEQIFRISYDEFKKYKATMKEWEADWLFFAVIPGEEPNRIIIIAANEMNDEPGEKQKVFEITDTTDRQGEISEKAYLRALQQLCREGHDVESVPKYPIE